MKKLLSIVFVLALSIGAFAQSTSPRFGTGPNQDNTGRVMTNKFISVADAVGADTIKLSPNASRYLIIPAGTITDSLAYSIKNIGLSCAGDKMEFAFINSSGSGHKIKFVGTGWQVGSSGTSISLTSAKRANIVFIFDGVAWVEVSRLVQ